MKSVLVIRGNRRAWAGDYPNKHYVEACGAFFGSAGASPSRIACNFTQLNEITKRKVPRSLFY